MSARSLGLPAALALAASAALAAALSTGFSRGAVSAPEPMPGRPDPACAALPAGRPEARAVEPVVATDGVPTLAPAPAAGRGRSAFLRAWADGLDSPSANGRLRAARETAAALGSAGLRRTADVDFVLDRLVGLDDPAAAGALARGMAAAGRDETTAAAVLARLEAGDASPAARATLYAVLGGAGTAADVAALRAHAAGEEPAALAAAVRAAARLGGPDADAFVRSVEAGDSRDLRVACAEAARLLARR